MTMKHLSYVLVSAMALAFGVSCSEKENEDWSGMEYITFDVEGKVTDKAGKPLLNIAVVTFYGDTARTDEHGLYKVAGQCRPVDRVNVDYVDTDKEDNGGRFMKTSKLVDLKYTGGDHGPYRGKYEADGVNVVMTTESAIKPVD